jgi:23S rRNA (cytidine1920-2'-O)/16S rRNA (cytidine1409-2'-O)-methyltransferase
MIEPSSPARQRADLLLVARGLFESRAKAQGAIAAGLVTADGVIVRKASEMIANTACLEATAEHPYVSRGGVKLVAALDHFGFTVTDRLCLDVGASTGGFTEVLLERGAAHVTAIDVGRDQLHPRLRLSPRVTSQEACDIRTLEELPQAPSLITVDVSFISLKLVLPAITRLAAQRAALVALVKPQFEAGRGKTHHGIVRDPAIHTAVCDDIAEIVRRASWRLRGLIPSPIEGRDGNREFLLGAERG